MSEAIDALIATGDFDEHSATELLHKLHKVGYTVYRKKQVKNGRRPNVSQPMTPWVAMGIREYFALHPNATQQEIAHAFNVNIGRVNEALTNMPSADTIATDEVNPLSENVRVSVGSTQRWGWPFT